MDCKPDPGPIKGGTSSHVVDHFIVAGGGEGFIPASIEDPPQSTPGTR